MSCQMAASTSSNIFHIDLKTAFFQGQSYDVNRDVVCHSPPEAGHPPYFAARLKKVAYVVNGAPRRWRNILDKALCCCGKVPTRADRCCFVLYSTQSRGRTRNQNNSTHFHDAAFDKMLDPIAGSPATGKYVAGIINLFEDDLLGTGGTEMEQRASARLRKDFHVSSEDWNDVTFARQRIRWMKDPQQTGPCIWRSAKERLFMNWRRSQWNETRKKVTALPLQCIPGTEAFLDINWQQSRKQFQCCYK